MDNMSLSTLADSDICITLKDMYANSVMPSLEDLGFIISIQNTSSEMISVDSSRQIKRVDCIENTHIQKHMGLSLRPYPLCKSLDKLAKVEEAHRHAIHDEIYSE